MVSLSTKEVTTMTARFKVPFFEPYFRRLEIRAYKREAEDCGHLARQMLDGVVHEQQPRLHTIRERGPWDYEREAAVLQQTKRAYEVLSNLKRYRGMVQRIEAMEKDLPAAAGLGRLRYANPWIITYSMAGIAVVLNVVSWFR
jgi:C4-dicarboxylate-specific signal transduction histidine kinase